MKTKLGQEGLAEGRERARKVSNKGGDKDTPRQGANKGQTDVV